MVIAADGRRSALAFGRGLARQPARPRRWAIGAYFTDVDGLTTAGRDARARGPLHRRRAGARRARPTCAWSFPHEPATRRLAPARCCSIRLSRRRSRVARPRFAGRAPAGPPVMLGPMAVDGEARGEPGSVAGGRCRGLHRSDDRRRPAPGAGGRRAGRRGRARGARRTRVAGSARTRRLAARRHAALCSRSGASIARCDRWSPRPAASPPRRSRPAVVPSLFERMIRYAGDC